MVDGPFRHTELPSGWKRFGKVIANKPMSLKDRATELRKILEKELLTKGLRTAVRKINESISTLNGHLFPELAIVAVLSGLAPSPDIELLARYLKVELADRIPPADALKNALTNTFGDRIEEYRERIEVHCLEAENTYSYENLQTNSNETFEQMTGEHFATKLLEPQFHSIQIVDEVDWPALTL